MDRGGRPRRPGTDSLEVPIFHIYGLCNKGLNVRYSPKIWPEIWYVYVAPSVGRGC